MVGIYILLYFHCLAKNEGFIYLSNRTDLGTVLLLRYLVFTFFTDAERKLQLLSCKNDRKQICWSRRSLRGFRESEKYLCESMGRICSISFISDWVSFSLLLAYLQRQQPTATAQRQKKKKNQLLH